MTDDELLTRLFGPMLEGDLPEGFERKRAVLVIFDSSEEQETAMDTLLAKILRDGLGDGVFAWRAWLGLDDGRYHIEVFSIGEIVTPAVGS